MAEELSEHELERYAEQIERIGVDGQRRLKAPARSCSVRARPASAAAAQLASAGSGYVAVVDGGAVAPADLCGQSVLYTPDVGANRAEAVAAKLGILNTATQAESYPVDVDDANAPRDPDRPRRRARLPVTGLALEAACARRPASRLLSARGGPPRDGLRAADEALELLAARAPATQGAPA